MASQTFNLGAPTSSTTTQIAWEPPSGSRAINSALLASGGAGFLRVVSVGVFGGTTAETILRLSPTDSGIGGERGPQLNEAWNARGTAWLAAGSISLDLRDGGLPDRTEPYNFRSTLTVTRIRNFITFITAFRALPASTRAEATLTLDDGATTVTAEAGGPYNVVSGSAVQLDGSGTEQNPSGTTTHAWEILSGGGSFDDATLEDPTYTPAAIAQGGSNVQVEVRYRRTNNSVSATDTAIITVAPLTHTTLPATDFRSGELAFTGGIETEAPDDSTLPATDFRSGQLAFVGGIETDADATLPVTDFRSGELAFTGGIETEAPDDSTLPATDFRSGQLAFAGGIETAIPDSVLPATDFRSGQLAFAGGVEIVDPRTSADPSTATEEPNPVLEIGSVERDHEGDILWTLPRTGEPVAEVVVDYRRDDETAWGGQRIVARTATSTTLENLENDRVYTARVRARNRIGNSVERRIEVVPTAIELEPIDANLKVATFAEATDAVMLLLLTITHPDLNAPIRVVNNTESVTSRGDEYLAFPFGTVLPTETDEEPGKAKLTIGNVTQEIGMAIRDIGGAPSVKIEVVLAAPERDAQGRVIADVVERRYPTFKLRNVTWDVLAVTGDLLLDDLRTESFPPGSFDPASFPGLFA